MKENSKRARRRRAIPLCNTNSKAKTRAQHRRQLERWDKEDRREMEAARNQFRAAEAHHLAALRTGRYPRPRRAKKENIQYF